MKVAVNTLFLIPGEVGGSETYLRETLLAMARHYPEVQLALITNRENDALLREVFESFPQCSFHLLPIRASNRFVRILAEQFRLPFVTGKLGPDLLWSPGYTMPFWAPCRQVVSILDMQYRSHPEDLTRLARWTTHALVMMAVRRANRIIAISEFSKQEIICHTGCSAERIAVTHLGVDAAFGDGGTSLRSDSGTSEIRDRRTNHEESQPIIHQPNAPARNQQASTLKPYILSVANSYPHKNLHRLAEAFASLAGDLPHKLVIVGRPRLGEPRLAKAMEKVPKDRIVRLSGLSREELVALYHGADLFVFPSRYEGFGLPVLEAMMAGVPVVTTREGSIPEVGGETVVYADGRDTGDLAEKIRKVTGMDPDQRKAMIDAGRARAVRFTWEKAAEATVKAFSATI